MRTVYFGGLDNIVGSLLCVGYQRGYYCLSFQDFSPFLGLVLVRVLPNDKNVPVSFEVWVVRSESRKEVFGKVRKAVLRFPSDEDFGTYAWSYESELAAVSKINSLRGGV